MPSNPIHFPPNIPQILSLSDPAGVPEGFSVSYPTTDGRLLILPRAVAIRLNALDVKCGESFGVCKRRPCDMVWGRPLKDLPLEWDLWLTPETEQGRAKQEEVSESASNGRPVTQQREEVMPETRGARGHSAGANQRQRTPRNLKAVLSPAIPRATDDTAALPPTGTDGPLPKLATMRRMRTGAIPYNIAFAEVCKFVTAGLKEAGEQWSDEARQGAVSTILIAAAKQGLLGVWER